MPYSSMGAAVGALLIAGQMLMTPIAARAQVSTDIVRGRITDASQAPVQGAEVKATSYFGQVSKTATTDKSGRFTIIFINGEGDYWIDVRKLGLQPKRFEVKKVGDEEVMIADARLSSAIVSLDAVDVRAQRTRALPDRSSKEPDVGGGARPLTNNPVSPEQEGNLAAMAAAAGFQLVPGLNGAPDMYSVLGLSGDQNNVTFNGLGSGISALPPDVLATTSINPYPFDVSRGGFSGAQISIQTIPGSNFSRRVVTNSSLAPQLEWADKPAAAQGDRYTSLRAGGNAAGPFKADEIFYNSAYNVGRRFKDASSLVDANATGLTAAGVAPDSVARFLNVLGTEGISVNPRGLPQQQAQDVAQGLINMDLMPSASGAGHSFTFGLAGDFRRTSPVDVVSPLLATPGHADATTFWGANASIVHTNYFWFGVLTKTTIGFAGQGTNSDPYQRLPEGIVSVASALPDGAGGSSVRSLSFGGNALSTSTANRTLQITNQLSWFSLDNTHTLRLTSSLGHDTFKSDVGRDLLGTFRFNSLSDVAGGEPASFTRTLTSTTQSGGQVVGALALGDYWRPKPGVQVQYGMRVDGTRFSELAVDQSRSAGDVRRSERPFADSRVRQPADRRAVGVRDVVAGGIRARSGSSAASRDSCRSRRLSEHRPVTVRRDGHECDRAPIVVAIDHVRGVGRAVPCVGLVSHRSLVGPHALRRRICRNGLRHGRAQRLAVRPFVSRAASAARRRRLVRSGARQSVRPRRAGDRVERSGSGERVGSESPPFAGVLAAGRGESAGVRRRKRDRAVYRRHRGRRRARVSRLCARLDAGVGSGDSLSRAEGGSQANHGEPPLQVGPDVHVPWRAGAIPRILEHGG